MRKPRPSTDINDINYENLSDYDLLARYRNAPDQVAETLKGILLERLARNRARSPLENERINRQVQAEFLEAIGEPTFVGQDDGNHHLPPHGHD